MGAWTMSGGRRAADARGSAAAEAARPARAVGGVAARREHLPVARVCVDLVPRTSTACSSTSSRRRSRTTRRARAPGSRCGSVRRTSTATSWSASTRPSTTARCSRVRKVVSAEPVLTPQVARLARAVADRWAGTLERRAAPRDPRAARPGRGRGARTGGPQRPGPPSPSGHRVGAVPRRSGLPPARHRRRRPAGGVVRAARCRRASGGPTRSRRRSPRACWAARGARRGARRPGHRPGARRAGGRRRPALDARDDAAAPSGSPPTTARRRGTGRSSPRCAVRRRSSSAPGRRRSPRSPTSGSPWCWDDGDPLHAEPRAPYPHVREVLALRVRARAVRAARRPRTGAASRRRPSSSRGWAREVAADRATTRARAAARAGADVGRARPRGTGRRRAAARPRRGARCGTGWPTARSSCRCRGPGYVPAVACGRCRAAARCGVCHGPLGLTTADGVPHVRLVRAAGHGLAVHRVRCGRAAVGPRRLGADRRGARPRVPGRPDPRLGRPCGRRRAGVRRRTCRRSSSRRPAPSRSRPGGYAAALLLDAAVSTAGASLRTGEDALRRWLDGRGAGASGVRGRDGRARRRRRGAGRRRRSCAGTPSGYASRELAERAELALPPAVRMAAVTGPRDAVDTLLSRLDLADAEILGPVPVDAGRAGRARAGRPGRSSACRVPAARRWRARCPRRWRCAAPAARAARCASSSTRRSSDDRHRRARPRQRARAVGPVPAVRRAAPGARTTEAFLVDFDFMAFNHLQDAGAPGPTRGRTWPRARPSTCRRSTCTSSTSPTR